MKRYLGEDLDIPVISVPASFLMTTEEAACDDPLYYTHDSSFLDFQPLKRIRVNFHFMNSEDSLHNISGKAAIQYAKDLIYYANRKLDDNKKMKLPVGNSTEVLPISYRYHLQGDGEIEGDKGVYFHYDNEHYYFLNKGKDRNNYSRKLIDKYAIHDDTILNIFYLNHHPDSIVSRTYTASGSGIALGSSVKLGVVHTKDTKPWKYASLLNHEVGHVFGLRHAWTGYDGCDDTPKHPNCWTAFGAAPCDGEKSNNFMDYNPDQNSFTPCQLGKIEKIMLDDRKFQRALVIPKWCTLDDNYTIEIFEETNWLRAKDLYGNLIIRSGAKLQINCQVSMPANSKIIVEPGAELVLNNCRIYNSCDYYWKGIEVQSRKGEKGQVFYYGFPRLENCDFPLDFNIDVLK